MLTLNLKSTGGWEELVLISMYVLNFTNFSYSLSVYGLFIQVSISLCILYICV